MTTTGPGQEVGAEALADFFARTPRLAVAFSGGCDSSYLLAAAVRAGCDVKAYGVRTAFQPAFEIDDARRLAAELGADFELIDADVLARDEVCANGPDRCYRCKAFIFSTLLERMARDGYEILADGTNATDDPANRPGFQALAELGVTSPLRRAGMTKEAVRAASRDSSLFTADKPSFSCLAVHVPKGEIVTQAALDAAAARLGVEDGKRPVGGSVGGKRPVGDSGSCEARNRPGRFVLETDRLLLRELTRRDFAALCTMLQDDEVMYAYEGALSDDDAQAWLDRQLHRYARDGFGLWAVVLKETGELIGQCGLTLQDVDAQGTRGVEVGYLFCREFWHRGFATEAARACRDFAFDELGAGEVFSVVRDTNVASQSVALRNGMVPRRTFVKHYRGVDMPHIVFSVTRAERGARVGR